MMSVNSSLVFLFLLVLHAIAEDNFPSYLEKCKNDENLNECFLKKAQAGISHILKGDPKLKIPSYINLKVPNKINLGTNNFKCDGDNLVISAGDLTVTEATWDTQKKVIYLKIKFIKVPWEFDASIDGEFLDEHISANGHMKKLYENGWVTYEMEYDTVDVNGVSYPKVKGGKAEFSEEKITYTIDNLSDEMNEAINKNWEQMDQIMHPQVQTLVFHLISIPFEAIFAVTPMDQLYL